MKEYEEMVVPSVNLRPQDVSAVDLILFRRRT